MAASNAFTVALAEAIKAAVNVAGADAASKMKTRR